MINLEQVNSYNDKGYLVVENAIPQDKLKELQRVSMTLEMASGRAGFGVGMRKRSLTNVPFSVSTTAPFIPEPPTSIPSISIIY